MSDDINIVASVISAVCAVIGVVIAVLGLSRPQPMIHAAGERSFSSRALYAFLLTSSGWILAVLSFLWMLEPFGPYITKREYLQIAGVMVVLPALLILRAGTRLLGRSKSNCISKSESEKT